MKQLPQSSSFAGPLAAVSSAGMTDLRAIGGAYSYWWWYCDH